MLALLPVDDGDQTDEVTGTSEKHESSQSGSGFISLTSSEQGHGLDEGQWLGSSAVTFHPSSSEIVDVLSLDEASIAIEDSRPRTLLDYDKILDESWFLTGSNTNNQKRDVEWGFSNYTNYPEYKGHLNDPYLATFVEDALDRLQKLALREVVPSKEQLDMLMSMNNHAWVLHRQGKYDLAEKMHRQTLGLREIMLGGEHPDTLTSMDGLAQILHSQGKLDEAVQMERQVLKLREKGRVTKPAEPGPPKRPSFLRLSYDGKYTILFRYHSC